MDKKRNALLLKAVSVGEKDKILTLLSLEEGLMTAKIKGVKNAGAKLKFASEPFCFAEYVFSSTGDRNTVISASLYDGFYPIRENFFAFYAGSVVLEFCRQFCVEGEPFEGMLLLANETLSKLSYSDDDKMEVLVFFLLKALSLTGYALKTDGCLSCEEDIEGRVFFESSSGGFLCLECVGETGLEISRSTYAVLKKIGNGEPLTEIENKDFYVKRALKLIDFYINDRTSTTLKSLKDIIEL